MKIKVEERHIKEGYRAVANYCPIALAVREQLKLDKKFRCAVSSEQCYIGSFGYRLPLEAREFIRLFDGNYRDKEDWRKPAYKPFEFELPIGNMICQLSPC